MYQVGGSFLWTRRLVAQTMPKLRCFSPNLLWNLNLLNNRTYKWYLRCLLFVCFSVITGNAVPMNTVYNFYFPGSTAMVAGHSERCSNLSVTS